MLVFFFGEHNYSLVSSDAIAPFEEFMAKASRKRRSKVLRAAIREAEAVHNGELVIDESAFVAEEEVDPLTSTVAVLMMCTTTAGGVDRRRQ